MGLNLSRRGEVASNFSESSGHRIDEFRAVGFRTRFEGSQSAHHLLHQISKPPEKVAADAVGKIQRLQAATATLGNSKAVKPLQEVVHVAQARASVPQSKERVDSCKLFLTCQEARAACARGHRQSLRTESLV